MEKLSLVGLRNRKAGKLSNWKGGPGEGEAGRSEIMQGPLDQGGEFGFYSKSSRKP